MTLPDVPELVVLAIISTAIVGLLNLETLGEWIWKLRLRYDSSISARDVDGSQSPPHADPTSSPDEEE